MGNLEPLHRSRCGYSSALIGLRPDHDSELKVCGDHCVVSGDIDHLLAPVLSDDSESGEQEHSYTPLNNILFLCFRRGEEKVTRIVDFQAKSHHLGAIEHRRYLFGF